MFQRTTPNALTDFIFFDFDARWGRKLELVFSMVSSLLGGTGMSSQFAVSHYGSICGETVLKDMLYLSWKDSLVNRNCDAM